MMSNSISNFTFATSRYLNRATGGNCAYSSHEFTRAAWTWLAHPGKCMLLKVSTIFLEFPKGAFAIIAKYHHAAIDGVSGQEIMSGLHSTTPEFESDPDVEDWEPQTEPSWLGLLTRAAVNNIRQPFQLAKAVSATLPGISQASAQGRVAGDHAGQ